MRVRERILAIRLIDKERKNKSFFNDLGVEIIQSDCRQKNKMDYIKERRAGTNQG